MTYSPGDGYGGGGVSDHGLLSGLADDDHAHYVHISTARTISAAHTTTGGINLTRSSAANLSATIYVTGDTVARFGILADGKHEWGSGSATRDASVSRAAANILRANNTEWSVWRDSVASAAYSASVTSDAQARFAIYPDGKHEWGSGSAARDVTLERSSADILSLGVGDSLRLPGTTAASYGLFALVTGDSVSRFAALADGKLEWGSGSATRDVAMYREGANALIVTGAYFHVQRSSAGNASFLASATGDTTHRHFIGADGKHEWGSGSAARDVTLWRHSAGILAVGTSSQAGAIYTYGASAAGTSWATFVTGDTYGRMGILANGTIQWGPGNAVTNTELVWATGGYPKLSITGANLYLDRMVAIKGQAHTVAGSIQPNAGGVALVSGNGVIYLGDAGSSSETPTGTVIHVKKTDSGTTTTITPNFSRTIDGAANYPMTAQYQAATFWYDGTNWHVIG